MGVRSVAWARKGPHWLIEPKTFIALAEAGDHNAARQIVVELRRAFSARADQPLRPDLRRYLAKALSKLLDDSTAAEAFNLRQSNRRPVDKGKDLRELAMAARYLKLGLANKKQVVETVAKEFLVSGKTVEAAVTRWTLVDGGRRLLVFSPRRPKKPQT